MYIFNTLQEERQPTKRRVGKYPLTFREKSVGRMKDCPSVSALAKELGIDRSNLYEWVEISKSIAYAGIFQLKRSPLLRSG
jgi:hypothetical protein